jgi:hypothetical protein
MLPSSLTRFLSRALVYSYPSTCVGLGTVAGSIARRFSWQPSITHFAALAGRSPSPLGVARADFPAQAPCGLGRTIHQVAGLASCMLHHSNSCRQYGIINPLSIDYAFRPRLRHRLTPGGRTCPGKPWNSGGRDSHPTFRYSCPHSHFRAIHARFPLRFDSHGTLLYHPPKGGSAASASGLLPIIFGAGSLD